MSPWIGSPLSLKKIASPPPPDRIVGGHAIIARGWNDARGLKLQNSWGAKWGRNGTCWLPYAYLTAQLNGRQAEAWAMFV